MRAPSLLVLIAVVASPIAGADQPDKTRSLRSADTATAHFTEERTNLVMLEETVRGVASRQHARDLLKPQAASFKTSGQLLKKRVPAPQKLKLFTNPLSRRESTRQKRENADIKRQTWELLNEGNNPEKVIDEMRAYARGITIEQYHDIIKTIDTYNEQHGIKMKEILVTWLMQGKTKEEVEKLLMDGRFIPQEWVNNRDVKAFDEVSKNPEHYIEAQIKKWIEEGLNLDDVAVKLESDINPSATHLNTFAGHQMTALFDAAVIKAGTG